MANTTIQLKHSTITGNVPSSLANGEISINSRDGKFFYSTPSGSIITHYPFSGPSGLDTEIQFNDGGSLGSSDKLTFNKTTGILTVNGGVTSNVFTDDGVDVYTFAARAFTQANSSYLQANTPSHTANSAGSYANSAFAHANASFEKANTSATIPDILALSIALG
jgi:hypothetical protein